MKRCGGVCSEKALRVVNIISCFLLLIVAVIRFAYLFDDFEPFTLFADIYLVVFVIVLFASEATCGAGCAKTTRTYFNMLDSIFGRGVFMCWLGIVFLDKTDRGEELFAIIAIIIALLNIVVGYTDRHLKPLPYKPWGEEDEEHAELEDRGADGDSKKTKELNKKKDRIERYRDAKRRLGEGGKDRGKDEKAQSDSSYYSSSSSEEVNTEYVRPEPKFHDDGPRWEDQIKTGFSKKLAKKNQRKFEKEAAKRERKRHEREE